MAWYTVITPSIANLINTDTGEIIADNLTLNNFITNYFGANKKGYISTAKWIIPDGTKMVNFEYLIDNIDSCRSALQQAINYAKNKSYGLPSKNGTQIITFYSQNGNDSEEIIANYVDYTDQYELGLGDFGNSSTYSTIYQQATKLTYTRNNLSQTNFLKLIEQVRQKINLPIPYFYPGDGVASVDFVFNKSINSWEKVNN